MDGNSILFKKIKQHFFFKLSIKKRENNVESYHNNNWEGRNSEGKIIFDSQNYTDKEEYNEQESCN